MTQHGPHQPSAPDEEPWWITNYRGSAYVERYGSHDAATTERDVDFLVSRLGLRTGHTILDLCCAFARHTRELTRRGYGRTTGVDLSQDMLRHAAATAEAAGERLSLLHADVRDLPLDDGHADAALLLFNSFGFLDTPEEDLDVLREAHRVLRAGGRFAMDHFTPHPNTIAMGSRSVRSGNAHTAQDVTWDPVSRRLNRETTTTYGDGTTETSYSSVRLYTPDELTGMLQAAGFRIDAQLSGYDGRPLSADSSRHLVLAHRP
ncbi:class I SAM-dependent methyltransferase [Streptomyces lonarensis]|uniref:Class I SAM-dependent methyltransferase n=1 Tax=Streptomyces lonarensis TaxID=700599 RepID=A0A7X6CWU8_9ACTN|nr:class I SAM-dependent methyltransferase [Streptomyces lonarensis]NJQ04017.1 class I SAM-dependent methyltransferase [Streptomyces lonarensis]